MRAERAVARLLHFEVHLDRQKLNAPRPEIIIQDVEDGLHDLAGDG